MGMYQLELTRHPAERQHRKRLHCDAARLCRCHQRTVSGCQKHISAAETFQERQHLPLPSSHLFTGIEVQNLMGVSSSG